MSALVSISGCIGGPVGANGGSVLKDGDGDAEVAAKIQQVLGAIDMTPRSQRSA